MSHIQDHLSQVKRQIAASYSPLHQDDNTDLIKAEVALIGEKRKFADGKEYMKTENGWVPVGTGTGRKIQKEQENAKIGMGGGAKVGKGSKISTKDGVHGTVKGEDEKHIHIEHSSKDGKKITSKLKHEDLSEKIQTGELQHHVPAKDALVATGAADKEKLSDPKEIKDTESAFDQMDNYFKGDKDAERTLKFLKDTIGGNKNIRIDTGMKFDDDRILGLSYPDGRIGVNVNSPLARDKESVYRTLMHEMVHAATRDLMKNNETLQDDFNNVLSQVRKHLDIPDNDSVASALYNNGTIPEDKYGVSNQYELIAEVFTNPDFAKLLKDIPYKKDNLLKQVMIAIFSAFGGTAKKVKDAKGDLKKEGVDNMADYLVNLTEKVFKPEVKGKRGTKKRTDNKSIKKSEEMIEPFNILEKGGVPAAIGEIRTHGDGVTRIKIVGGWRPVNENDRANAARRMEFKQDMAHTVAPVELIKEENALEAAPAVDINERFQAFARFTKAVIKGASKALIAYGTGGVGKTYTVTHQLDAAGLKPFDEDLHSPANSVASEGDDDDEADNEEGTKSTDYDYIKITGKMTGPQVFKALYQHNGKIILFDDCDSVLRDGGAVNLFKGALDSSGDGTVSWATSAGVKDEGGAKLPNRFKFNGRAIFISNLASADVPQPIKSRALRVDLSMNPGQTIERLRFIAKNKEGKYQNLKFPGVKSYKHEDLKDIVDYLDENKYKTSDLNVRTVGSLLSIKQIADEEGIAWRKDADHMIFSKSKSADMGDHYDGSEFQKARAAQISKSFGAPDKKEEGDEQRPTPDKKEKVTSHEHRGDEEDDQVDEKVDKFPGGPSDINKSFDFLILD